MHGQKNIKLCPRTFKRYIYCRSFQFGVIRFKGRLIQMAFIACCFTEQVG